MNDQVEDQGVLVFDVGGTNLRAAIYDPGTERLLRVERRETENHHLLPTHTVSEIAERLFRSMAEMGQAVMEGRSPRFVCVAFPGPIDGNGMVLSASTVWGRQQKEPMAIGKRFQDIWPKAKVDILNDVTAAGYRYAAQDGRDFCIVTVSSGIGSKVFINGRPSLGPAGRGGEIGHIKVDRSFGAPVCDCGGTGHLGAVASGRATVFQARQLFEEAPSEFFGSMIGQISHGDPSAIDNLSVVTCFRQGDPWTVKMIQRMADPLAQTLAGLHLALGLERFIIVGGFALALGDKYLDAIARSAKEAIWEITGDWTSMLALGSGDGLDVLEGAGRYATLSDSVRLSQCRGLS